MIESKYISIKIPTEIYKEILEEKEATDLKIIKLVERAWKEYKKSKKKGA